jgi:hypothetical protein
LAEPKAGGGLGGPSQNERLTPLLSVLGGATQPSLVSRKAVMAAACVLAVAIAVAGCGGGEGVSKDATVTAYVAAPLCVGARAELAREGDRAGDLHVKAICLPNARSASKLNLATVGADARRATEDSTTVGYLEAADPRIARFTHPILESASIAWISSSSGKAAMAKLLRAIEAADTGSLRESIREDLNEN